MDLRIRDVVISLVVVNLALVCGCSQVADECGFPELRGGTQPAFLTVFRLRSAMHRTQRRLRASGILDVLSSTPANPSGRKRHWIRRLTGLATKPGEISG